ncbi:MAG: transcriptional regulator NrdR [Pseudomonadota bacterium]
MHCPFCAAPDTKVVDSRLVADTNQIRRRRECVRCGERYTTYESVELNLPRVVKTNGERETFDEGKLRGGMQRALEKRPVSAQALEAAVSHIAHRAMVSGEREVPARRIGEWVMDELRELDQVAYVRFASVYRSFEDVNAFREEIERLEREPTAAERRDQLPLLDEAGQGGVGARPERAGGRRNRAP